MTEGQNSGAGGHGSGRPPRPHGAGRPRHRLRRGWAPDLADIAARTGCPLTVNAAVRRLEHEGLPPPGQTGRQDGSPPSEVARTAVPSSASNSTSVIRAAVSDLRVEGGQDEPAPPAALKRSRAGEGGRGGARPVRGDGIPRAVAVSVAKPVDPRTSAVIELPDTPYPEGWHPACPDPRADRCAASSTTMSTWLRSAGNTGIAKGIRNFAFITSERDRRRARRRRPVGAGPAGSPVRSATCPAGRTSQADATASPAWSPTSASGPRRRDAWYADTSPRPRTARCRAKAGPSRLRRGCGCRTRARRGRDGHHRRHRP